MNSYHIPPPRDEIVKLIDGEKFSSVLAFEHLTPAFAYDYISLTTSEFCFDGTEIKIADFIAYFRTAKILAQRTIKSLLDAPHKEFHFSQTPNNQFIKDINGKPKYVLRDILDRIPAIKNNRNTDEKYPLVYHFCIYPNIPETSPRIHFFLGNRGLFYPLVFDIKHQLVQSKKKPLKIA